MIQLFQMGGPLFMGILTILFLSVLLLSIRYFIAKEKKEHALNLIKSVGLFAMIVGVLGQLIGLFDAMKYIEEVGSISPQMLAGGFKVSMIPTLYGLVIYILSYLIWLGLSAKKA